MKVCLVSHGFPPVDRTGVENYTAALAAALARQGHTVEVFTRMRDERYPDRAHRRTERDGYGVTWLVLNSDPRGPREALDVPLAAERFDEFLAREQPDVVHFQHVIKLGVGLIERAVERGIPTVYTAHDYYPVCHRFTLLRPDLSHCDVRGDAAACARCDVALGYLNGIEGLGDYQIGVLPRQLEDDQRAQLASLLAGADPNQARAAVERRSALDARRAEVFARLDLVIAPTRFLRAELERGGLDGERIEVLPYGIGNADLRDVPPVRGDASAPVRFGFFGGLSKHKGVHHLLEAFARLRSPAELCVWGYTTDAPHRDALEARAEEVGADWRGAYERVDLPGLLAQVDVVVVPSIWVENYPLVIREAFSARRPVIAFDFGALPESVRHEVDGLLVPLADETALASAMERFAADPDLAARMARAIEPVKDVDEQARELVGRYRPLIEARRREREARRRRQPASLRPMAARHDELASLPTRALFARAMHGLERLRSELLGEEGSSVGELLAHGLSFHSDAKDAADDAAHEIAWRRGSMEEMARAFEAERAHLRARVKYAERGRDRLQAAVEDIERAITGASHEGGPLRDDLAALEAGAASTPELALAALAAQEHALSLELHPLLEHLDHLLGLPPRGPEERHGLTRLLAAAQDARRRLDDLAHELGWRREEMAAVVHKLDRTLLRLLLGRTALKRRVDAWANGGEGADEEESA